jgi:phospholipid-translocating ATPase
MHSFANLALLAVMCVLCAIASHFLEVYYYNRNAYWEVFAQYSDDNPSVNGAIAFANAMITFQNIVPISLYISIEFIRTFQAVFIWADDEIFYEPTNRRTIARSWNLSDDLGQIEYVFSDKTGTLTQNCMQFHHCTVGGVIYRGDDGVPAHVVTGGGEHAKARDSDTSSATRVGDDKAKIDGDSERGMAKNGHDATKTVKLSPDVVKPFHDAEIERALKDVDSPQARLLHGFFVNLALCHTVLAAEDEDGTIAYKAQSPDEAALVQAAADVGFIFCGRDKNILRLQTPADAEPVEYELLEVLEFTSARKRMSVVVRKLDDPNKPLFLLMKGADNIVFERLAPGQDEVRKTTGEHLDDFASEGASAVTGLASAAGPESMHRSAHFDARLPRSR